MPMSGLDRATSSIGCGQQLAVDLQITPSNRFDGKSLFDLLLRPLPHLTPKPLVAKKREESFGKDLGIFQRYDKAVLFVRDHRTVPSQLVVPRHYGQTLGHRFQKGIRYALQP